MKGDKIRALDVLLVGPVMILGGYKLYKQHDRIGGLLAFLGAATILYNYQNLIKSSGRE